MYKVCFDEDSKIIGFNIDKCMSYINLFDITHVNKNVDVIKTTDKLDSIGRRVFKKINKITGTKSIHYCVNGCDFEDNDYKYKKEVITKKDFKICNLINESNMFNVKDIVEEKKNQLIKHFDANDCLIIELFNNLNDNLKIENCVLYKDYLKADNNSNIKLTFNIESHKEMLIYCESDNNVIFKYNDIEINQNEYIKHKTKKVSLDIICNKKTDIYSIAILFR